MPLRTVVLGILPVILVAATVVAAAAIRGRVGPRSRTAWAGPLALALGYATADALVAGGLPGRLPSESHRLLPLAGLITAGALACLPSGGSVRARGMLALGVAALTFAWTLENELSHADTRVLGVAWWVLHSGFAGLLPAITAGAAHDRSKSPTLPRNRAARVRTSVTLLVSAAGGSLVFLQSSSAFFAQMAGAIAAVMAVFVAAVWWRPDLELPELAAPVYGVLFAGLVLCLPMTSWSRTLVLASAAAPALANLRQASRLTSVQLTTLCAGVAAMLCTLAVWQSTWGFDFSGY